MKMKKYKIKRERERERKRKEKEEHEGSNNIIHCTNRFHFFLPLSLDDNV